MISVAVVGASGRMGSLAIDLIDADANLKLHAALNSKSELSMMLGADVVVDFTPPVLTLVDAVGDPGAPGEWKDVGFGAAFGHTHGWYPN